MPYKLRIPRARYWFAFPSSNWIVTTVGDVAAEEVTGEATMDADTRAASTRPVSPRVDVRFMPILLLIGYLLPGGRTRAERTLSGRSPARCWSRTACCRGTVPRGR